MPTKTSLRVIACSNQNDTLSILFIVVKWRTNIMANHSLFSEFPQQVKTNLISDEQAKLHNTIQANCPITQ